MRDKSAFIDTNVLIYLYSGKDEDRDKRRRIHKKMSQYNCQISTQVLNEFSNTCIKKMNVKVKDVQNLIDQICSYCDLLYIDKDTINKALEIHSRYNYSYYDSLILASALEYGCDCLFTEDLSDGQIIEGSLTIKNILNDRIPVQIEK